MKLLKQLEKELILVLEEIEKIRKLKKHSTSTWNPIRIPLLHCFKKLPEELLEKLYVYIKIKKLLDNKRENKLDVLIDFYS